jgi:crotonobetainyl-CoA:carnitine CoA-transferase CaiB-like acyl-CoA transferase
VAMYDAILAFCERIIYQYSYTGVVPGPEGNSHPMLCPFGLFPVRDGLVAIACPMDQFWGPLARAMGRADLADHEQYRTNEARVAHNAEVVAMISAWTATQTKAQLKASLGGLVPFGPVNDVTDIFADPHVRARGMLAEIEHPGLARAVHIAGTPIKMTATPGGVHTRAPLLGEHSDQILTELGYSATEIQSMKQHGAIS